MKHLPIRLAIAFATFATGLLLTMLWIKPAPSRAPCEKNEVMTASSPSVSNSEATHPNPPQTTPGKAEGPDTKSPRIGQREIVVMPGVGRVRVTAFETDGVDAQLVFEDADSGKELRSITMVDDAFNPSLRFKTMHLKGLPDPMIVGLAISPGGSDSSWEAVAVGAVDGELKELTSNEPLQAGDRGGFYFGDLGNGRGVGVATWTDVWDMDYESHVAPHRYEVKLYKWNKATARFEWNKVFRTPGKFDSDKEALRSVRLHFNDVRASISGFKYLDGTD